MEGGLERRHEGHVGKDIGSAACQTLLFLSLISCLEIAMSPGGLGG